jgi:cell division septum initiation protein DivIVA
LASGWKSFPNGTPLDLSQKEYEQFQIQEINRYKEEVEKYGAKVNYEEQKLEDLEKQIDQLQDQVNNCM